MKSKRSRRAGLPLLRASTKRRNPLLPQRGAWPVFNWPRAAWRCLALLPKPVINPYFCQVSLLRAILLSNLQDETVNVAREQVERINSRSTSHRHCKFLWTSPSVGGGRPHLCNDCSPCEGAHKWELVPSCAIPQRWHAMTTHEATLHAGRPPRIEPAEARQGANRPTKVLIGSWGEQGRIRVKCLKPIPCFKA